MSAIPLLSNMLHTRNLRRSIEREKIGTAPSHNLQNEMFSKSMHQQQNKEQQNQTVNVKLAQPPAQAALEGGIQAILHSFT
ncbi:hypothetical protein WR25_23480 [Diploscapter pachys]|uniref:Uncharacterized protein n=1 Tax=Diploscapter pachys TaxID=2018661 RepID=A0A2A2JUW2_9BILA|nr:hypothetical protein WR25_26931 [Diploscapter pachys]PAV82673.1 hypothetical protein WR25_23480 [Diploscapter pachys]